VGSRNGRKKRTINRNPNKIRWQALGSENDLGEWGTCVKKEGSRGVTRGRRIGEGRASRLPGEEQREAFEWNG